MKKSLVRAQYLRVMWHILVRAQGLRVMLLYINYYQSELSANSIYMPGKGPENIGKQNVSP
jgi:hypothetical protein